MAEELQANQFSTFMLALSRYRTPQLLFLDEVSTDNRNRKRLFAWTASGVRPRTKSYFMRGKRYSTVGLFLFPPLFLFSSILSFSCLSLSLSLSLPPSLPPSL